MLTISHSLKKQSKDMFKLTEEAKKFKSDIFILTDGKRVDAKKITEVARLITKSKLVIEIEGVDEKNAFDRFAIFLERNM